MEKFLVKGTFERDYTVCVEAEDADQALEIAGMLSSEQCLGDPMDYDRNHRFEATVAGDDWKEYTNMDDVYTKAKTPSGYPYVITKFEEGDDDV